MILPPETIFHQPENVLTSIEHLYAFVSVSDDGSEGLCGAPMGPIQCMPLIAADERKLDILRPIAKELAKMGNCKIKLIRLSQRTELEEFNP